MFLPTRPFSSGSRAIAFSFLVLSVFLNELDAVPRSTPHALSLSLLVHLLSIKCALCCYRKVQEMFTVQGHAVFSSSQWIADDVAPLVPIRESRFLNVDYNDRTFTVFFRLDNNNSLYQDRSENA
jgi:hypothetical protein